ncbi:HK97-gp10 family putative phage morphogenesis protein [Tissierella creatinophila]|uniref:Phage protein, HK97 gp10 family n=1 Tax=Tissierella creatinophila DSM 6911 TaxID=1123403 RepID=A0A1U7M2N6_TISCR|nr:HK97-gp10 family putative phage morphogenesis protein [Tissierella creatinophila]OLS01582.1 hypothetical protein TICRE_24060 [Tissierella creatinophila DSM 6911]
MAKVDIKMPDEFLLKVSKLDSDFDPVAEKILKAGGEVIFKRTKSNLSAVVGKGTKHESRSTGELEKALGVTSVRLDRNGNHNIKIGFSEPRPDGESNAKIANILEYGKHGQPAKPFLKPAKSASKSECISVMKSTFEEEVKKI